MKIMKVALLATAALAAVSVSARADDAAAIKAQLEALTARIAQLEAGPALPAGYSLLTISTVDALTLTGEKASDVSNIRSHRISVLPTADVPAATTIDWDLEVRAVLTHWMVDSPTSSEDDTEITARGRIRVKASTDTSVGTVGVDLRLEGASEFDDGANTYMNIAWGWWQMTPEWTFGGGYTGTLSDPGHGQDGWATYGKTIGYGQGDQEQFRLTYASGPLTWAIALEDQDSWTDHMHLAVASRLDYAGDAFSASLSGYYAPEDTNSVGIDDSWQVAAGADFGLGDMATISAAGAIGSGFGASDDYSSATVFVGFDLTDTTSIEASAGQMWVEGSDNDSTVFNAGVYWKPADQLKIGLQADHIEYQSTAYDTSRIAFVTWFSY